VPPKPKKPAPPEGVPSPRPLMGEIGTTGLRQSRGIIDEEILRELQGLRGIRVYAEMQCDPIVSAGLTAIALLIRGAEWAVEPASASDEDQEAADFLVSVRDGMTSSWADTISEILSMLPYGWSYHEIVYHVREADGLVGWECLPIRSQDSLDHWEFDERGRVAAMVQRDPNTYRLATIPADKALLFRPSAHRGNPQGISVLRAAYTPWYWKANTLRFEGIGIERDLAGLPLARVPASVLAAGGPNAKAWEKMVTEIRRNRQSGAVIPSDPHVGGSVRQYDLELLRASGPRQFDTSALVTRYNTEIATSMLAMFLTLGANGKTGSYAQASSQTELFAVAIGAYLTAIAETFNRDAVPRLLALNPSIRGKARFAPGDVETVDIGQFAAAWQSLALAGFDLTPADEGWFRSKVGMPPALVAEESAEGEAGDEEPEPAAPEPVA